MKYKRLIRKIPIDIKLISSIFIAGILVCMFFFTSPQQVLFIPLFIILITLLSYFISSYFVQKKFQYIAALGTFLFFTINHVIGFDFLNTMLLVSFIIGLIVLVR